MKKAELVVGLTRQLIPWLYEYGQQFSPSQLARQQLLLPSERRLTRQHLLLLPFERRQARQKTLAASPTLSKNLPPDRTQPPCWPLHTASTKPISRILAIRMATHSRRS